jgi:hypothetical protein
MVTPPDPWDNLRLDYEQTLKYFYALHESRFKLLALLPVVTGAALSTADTVNAPQRSLALGVFGFLISLGLTFYEIRNTQLYDAMQVRAKSLETFLGFSRAGNPKSNRSGPLLQRPPRARKLFGVVKVWHDRALSIVYATLLAAWSYLIAAASAEVLRPRASHVGFLVWTVPSVVWVAFVVQLHLYDNPTDETHAFPKEVVYLLQQSAAEPWLDAVPPEARTHSFSPRRSGHH